MEKFAYYPPIKNFEKLGIGLILGSAIWIMLMPFLEEPLEDLREFRLSRKNKRQKRAREVNTGVHGGGQELSISARYLVNRRSHESQSLIAPCPWVKHISEKNIQMDNEKPASAKWCDKCFPEKADG